MKVKLTIAESKCRSGYFKAGGEFIVEDLCPPAVPRVVECHLSLCVCITKWR